MLLYNHRSLSWVGTRFLCALTTALRMCGPWTHWQHRMYHKVLFVHSCNAASLIETCLVYVLHDIIAVYYRVDFILMGASLPCIYLIAITLLLLTKV